MNNKEIEEFVEIWMWAIKMGNTIENVREELGWENRGIVSNRASYLRDLGYNLPRINPGIKVRYRLKKKANEIINKNLQSL